MPGHHGWRRKKVARAPEKGTRIGSSGAELTEKGPTKLFFRRQDGRRVKAGSWALDLARLGRMFAAVKSDSPVTLALSLPALDFAGPLVAAGFVAERAERGVDDGPGADAGASQRAQLFRQLCALAAETPVMLRRSSGKVVRAVFERVERVGGEPWAVIRFQTTSKGRGSEYINEAQAERVVFATGLNAEAMEGAVGKPVNVRLGLAEAFIASQSALRELFLRSAHECALIGVVKRLSDELCGVGFQARRRNGSTINGVLQNIVRSADLARAHEVWRAKLFSVRAKPEETAQWTPRLAVFRGSSAYVRQAERFPAAHHVALLSPTERDFDAAVNALNQGFLNRRNEISHERWAAPEGAAAMGFERRSPQVR